MIDVRRIARQIERRENRAEEQPGAEFARHQVGVLALPAQPRRLRQRLFHHGCGIDKHLYIAARCGDQPARQCFQPLLDQVVIVVALGIDRNRAAAALLQDRQRVLIGPVIDAEHDDGAHLGPQHPRIGAALGVSAKPVHVAMAAGLDKGVKMFSGVADRGGIGDADGVEAERKGFVCEGGMQISGFDGPQHGCRPREGGDP